MIQINIHDAKTNLSKYLAKLENEGKIVICKHNKPIAEIIPIKPVKHQNCRPIGLAEGEFTVPPSFFEPLPEEYIRLFHGE